MFIPRHPVVENQFCKFASQTDTGATGVGGVIAYAGSVIYLDPAAAQQESEIKAMAHGVTEVPFGFMMQKVKTGYHSVHPAGFVMPGDLGSSDVIAQPTYNSNGVITGTRAVPVGVAHLGIWDTVHYTAVKTVDGGGVSTATGNMVPGAALYPAADSAKLTDSTVDSAGAAADTQLGKRCSTTIVARVVKGVSAAKSSANINNTTLYPIRVKILV